MFINFKYSTRLFGSAAISFFKINVLGQSLFILINTAILFTLLYQSGTGMGHTQGLAFVLILLERRPIGCMFFLIHIVAVPFVLFSCGNKYIVRKTINKIVSENGEVILVPIIDKILSKIKSHQPELLRRGADRTKLQLKIIQEIKESNENRWLKKILTYVFKKFSLNDIDFRDVSLSIPDIIKGKITIRLQNMSKPSRLFFWLVLVFELTILTLVIIKVI